MYKLILIGGLMSKLLKLISVALLGIVLSSGAFAKTEVVYIPKNLHNQLKKVIYLKAILKKQMNRTR